MTLDCSNTAAQTAFTEMDALRSGYERYDAADGRIIRTVIRRDGVEIQSSVPCVSATPHMEGDLAAAFDAAWLRAKREPGLGKKARSMLRIVDLFSGCGGLSLGLREACRALAIRAEFVFACDMNEAAIAVYEQNMRPRATSREPLESLVDGEIGSDPTHSERALIERIGKVDFVIAGPPCQGHSDLNNHTRRADAKNELVIRVARFVELFQPRFLMIENVPGIKHDKLRSLSQSKAVLAKLGYSFVESLVSAHRLGVPQSRKRFILMAVRSPDPLRPIPDGMVEARPISWAISDLEVEGATVFDSSARHSAENQRRIRYLFDRDLYELPNAERPACHRDKEHSYTGVYGRMRWDRPAPTVTTGFGSAGQGRFVHPRQPRTMTPHEAARVQFFPDFFQFGELGRRQYQQLIGNAVPSKLAYHIALEQLR